MIVKSTQKANLVQSQISFDSDTFFIEKNGYKDFIYYSKEKCKSLEYIADKLIDEVSIFVYEDLDDDKIYIIKTHLATDTLIIDINSKNFEIKKTEDIINLILFKQGIEKIYFLDNSALESKMNIKNASTGQVSLKDFKQISRKAPLLRTRNTYTFKVIIVFIALLLLNNGFTHLSEKLEREKRQEFNAKNIELDERLIAQDDDISKYNELKNKRLGILRSFEEMNTQNMIPSGQGDNL